MNSILEFFIESPDRSRSFRMVPAIVMMILFLAFFGAMIYVLVNSFS